MLMIKLNEEAVNKVKDQKTLDEQLKVKVSDDNRLYFTDISTKR